MLTSILVGLALHTPAHADDCTTYDLSDTVAVQDIGIGIVNHTSDTHELDGIGDDVITVPGDSQVWCGGIEPNPPTEVLNASTGGEVPVTEEAPDPCPTAYLVWVKIPAGAEITDPPGHDPCPETQTEGCWYPISSGGTGYSITVEFADGSDDETLTDQNFAGTAQGDCPEVHNRIVQPMESEKTNRYPPGGPDLWILLTEDECYTTSG